MAYSESEPSLSGSANSDEGSQAEVAQDEPRRAGPRASDPEPRASGLTVEPASRASRLASSSTSQALDIVIVHGLYGGVEDASRENPGSGTSGWANEYTESLDIDSRILRFGYDASRVLAGHGTREAIREQALFLLYDLENLRRTESKNRSIMFVAHDIGGVIVKDALVAAAFSTGSWTEIFDCSRMLVFCGCPHRSRDGLDMENRLARFLFTPYGSVASDVSPAVSSIQGLANAVIEINGLFIESRILLRSHVISIHAPSFPGGKINSVFDNYAAAIGVPFERRIAEDWAEGAYPGLLDHLERVQAYLIPNPELLRHERTIMSLALLVRPFKTAQQALHSTTESDICQAWLDHPGPQLLLVHGSEGVRDAGEQMFYRLNDLVRSNKDEYKVVLYFSFDRCDSRCDSIKDMLSTFLAQIICHHTNELSQWVEVLFEILNEERGWTESDLICLFEWFRRGSPVSDVWVVIDHFDECTDTSRKYFVDFFSHLVSAKESAWKIAITSRKPGAILDEVSEWPHLVLDVVASEVAPDDPRDTGKDIARLTRYRPELSVVEDVLRHELAEIADLDPLARYVVCEQLRFSKEWPRELSIETFLGPLDDWKACRDDRCVAKVVDRVLRRNPDQELVRLLLSWLLYSVRPLTIWELATVMFVGSGRYPAHGSCPSLPELQELISTMEAWFAGIVKVEQNEFVIHSARLRDIFSISEVDEGHKYLWNEVEPKAHLEITKLCLGYLSQASVQERLEYIDHPPASGFIEPSTLPDRSDLCSYAVQFWAHHFSLIPPNLNPSKLLDDWGQSAILPCWFRAYHALSNPVTRGRKHLESLYPIFAGLGLLYVVRPGTDEDYSLALVEAAKNGQTSVVKSLLPQAEHSKSTLLQALVAAGSSGEEEAMLDIVDCVVTKISKEPVDWPPVLLYRAARLGLSRIAERLLSLGCAADPGGPLQIKPRTSPLLLTARYGHRSTARVLLSHKANARFLTFCEQTPLHVTAGQGYSEMATLLVQEGEAELEHKDESGLTPLYFASLWGNFKSTEALLRLGADPDMGITGERTSQGWSPLMAAADGGYEKCVRALLKQNANPNVSGPSGIDTPLRYAAVKGHMQICRLLLESGADANSPLIQPPVLVEVLTNSGSLSKSKKLEMVELLLENSALVDATDDEGMTALAYAVRRGYLPHAKCLLDHNADINLAEEEGNSPLHHAVEGEREDMVELLLSLEPALNNQNSSGLTPLHISYPDVKIASLLLEKGARSDLRSGQGLTPLMDAALGGSAEHVKLLLKHKVAVNAAVDEDSETWPGLTALSFAALSGSPDVVRLLAEAGADLKHETKVGAGHLHLAVGNDSLGALLEFRKRIDLEEADVNGDTALNVAAGRDLAVRNVKLLVHGGANVNTQNRQGVTPISAAASSNNPEVVSFLLEQDDLDINLGSQVYGAALHQACRKSYIDIVKNLVEHGADVNSVPGKSGSPLQSVFLRFTDNEEDLSEELLRYLIKKGADVRAQGGDFGSPINAAAFAGTPSSIGLLLDEGATVEVSDGFGRTPIHFAAVQGSDNFERILQAGGNINARDKMQRTALHWAAQYGRAQVVESILLTQPRETADEQDIDGWTPLCWAVRGTEGYVLPSSTREEADQLKVVRLLLRHGANRFVAGSILEQKWSPIIIARDNCANAEIIDLVTHGLRQEGDDGFEKEAVASSDDTDKDQIVAQLKGAFCDACLWTIRGLSYECEDCPDFHFCNKCYARRDILHADHPRHTFKEKEPELEVVAESRFFDDDLSFNPDSDSDLESHAGSDPYLDSDSDRDSDRDSGSNLDSDSDLDPDYKSGRRSRSASRRARVDGTARGIGSNGDRDRDRGSGRDPERGSGNRRGNNKAYKSGASDSREESGDESAGT